MADDQLFTIAEAAKRVGVHGDTLRRWVKTGKVPEPSRDRNDWRMFTEDEVREIVAYATLLKPSPAKDRQKLQKTRRAS